MTPERSWFAQDPISANERLHLAVDPGLHQYTVPKRYRHKGALDDMYRIVVMYRSAVRTAISMARGMEYAYTLDPLTALANLAQCGCAKMRRGRTKNKTGRSRS
jgi:hypothetical protein